MLPTERQCDAALQIVAKLRAAGHEAYLAGGCVRDLLLGRAPKDYDVATAATPDAVLKMFPRAYAVERASEWCWWTPAMRQTTARRR